MDPTEHYSMVLLSTITQSALRFRTIERFSDTAQIVPKKNGPVRRKSIPQIHEISIFSQFGKDRVKGILTSVDNEWTKS